MTLKTWAILASTASMLSATAALAQSAPAPTSAPATPAAAEQEQDGVALGDIIVTAQRRSENLQNVPISITAANADALATARVENISNIQAISPSISFRVTNIASSSANVIIRGLGTTGNSRSFEGSVGVFIDGVYRSRAASALQNFLDIDNLQVLRGPQGTLFGKNTTAGALLLTSTLPDPNQVSGLVDLSYSNYDTVLARAAVGVPLTDTLTFRIAALSSTRDGFFTDATSGRPLNNDASQAVKAQLRFEPSSAFSIRLIGDYSNSEGNCCYATADFVDGPTQPLVNALTQANGKVLPSRRLSAFSQSLDATNQQQIQDYGGTALISIGVGEGEIRSVFALRKFTVGQRDADADFSGASILSLDEDFSSRFISQELTYTGKIEAVNADLVLGGFFSDEKLEMARDLAWGTQAQTYWNTLLAGQGVPAGTASATPGRVATEVMGGRARSYAAFGHLDFAIGSKFNIIAGLRYSIEEKQGDFRYSFYDPRPNAVFKLLGVSPGPAYDAEIRNKALSGTFGLQYRPVDDLMIYATYNRGFKAGGVNIDANGAGTLLNNPAEFNALPAAVRGLVSAFNGGATVGQPQNPTYEPETVNAYEVGAKFEYLDGRARTNVALFYYDISNVQIAQFVGLQFTVLNANAAKDYGVEFENLFQLTSALTLGLDGTWLPHASYEDDAGIDPVLSGSRFRFAPKFQGNATLNLDQPITDDLNLTARVQYQYSGRQLINTASLTERGAVNMINANLGFKLKSGLSVEGWAQNVTNEIYPSQSFNTPLQTGDQNAYLAPPRTYGIRLRAQF
ncbi:TonB-dependent receptor [Sphingomonas radiodurans]|uniref:TonB-dependent receptor n=1 Tax=Sphingomonas radiodurans TaxID=2890321 RepID=UPI001E40366B|nr:TonB-dependent receptor [Sphingomonas radiodurans]WBH15080.1 TonB-dependent receptor [Sphingomonas radiodurans]